MNVEADEAGRLRAFRERFGRGWDARTNVEEEEESEEGDREDGGDEDEQNGSLMDLISGYGQATEEQGTAKGVREEKTKSKKGTGGER